MHVQSNNGSSKMRYHSIVPYCYHILHYEGGSLLHTHPHTLLFRRFIALDAVPCEDILDI